MKHYNIVAAVVYHNGKYLCMQKGKTKYDYTSYKYEFPGGKIEAGETPEQALKRELIEEMNYDIEIKKELIAIKHEYPDFSITMKAFLCTVTSTDFILKEHINSQWMAPALLTSLDWAAADIGIVKAVMNLHSPLPCGNDHLE